MGTVCCPSLLQPAVRMGLILQQGQGHSWAVGWGAQGGLWGISGLFVPEGLPRASWGAQRCLGAHRGTWGSLPALGPGFAPSINLNPKWCSGHGWGRLGQPGGAAAPLRVSLGHSRTQRDETHPCRAWDTPSQHQGFGESQTLGEMPQRAPTTLCWPGTPQAVPAAAKPPWQLQVVGYSGVQTPAADPRDAGA